jgi:hypothetical protein
MQWAGAVSPALAAMTGTNALTNMGGNSVCFSDASTYVKLRSDAAMETTVKTKPITAGEYTASTVKTETTYSQPSLTEQDWQNIAAQFTRATADDKEAENRLAADIDPGYEPGEDASTFLLLEPGTQETYPEYISRLRAAGWLGTATVTVLAEDEALGPAAVQNIAVYADANFQQTYTRPWTAPRLASDVDLRLRVNPGDPATGGGTGDPELPPDDGCTCPPIDLEPLGALPYVESFPFGLVAWARDGILGQGSGTDGPDNFTVFGIEIDLQQLDPLMAIVRGTLAFSMVAGIVWVYARRSIGWDATDD